jgi:5-methylcytosine-specific restriction endonuclease McrA
MSAYDQSRVYQPYRTFRPAGSHPNPAHWQSIRLQALERDGFQCRCCPAKEGDVCDVTGPIKLEVHHRHYRSWGKESLDDVTVLCKQCHRGVTDRFMWWRDKARTPALSSSKLVQVDSTPVSTSSLSLLKAVQSTIVESTPVCKSQSKALP